MDWDSLMDCQGVQSQKEGQEEQGEVKELEAVLCSSFTFPWSSSGFARPYNALTDGVWLWPWISLLVAL